MYYVESGASFEAIVEVGTSGLVGTIEWQIVDNLGNVVSAPITTGIAESPAGSGFYQGTRNAPVPLGQYGIAWSDDGSFTANHTFVDDLTVVAAGAGDALPPISPIGPGPGAVSGPCNAWTTNEDVAACCDAVVGTDYELFEEAATAASRTLWTLSGRLYNGTCDRTVRPCTNYSGCFQVLDRGHIVGDWNGWGWNGTPCGCSPVSEVKLWYPVREVIEVKIDGDVVPSTDYFIYDRRKLVRKNGGRWPVCQDMSRDATEDGTFSVRFTYGQNPPQSGQMAARELACEIYKSCSSDDGNGECRLPTGVTRITRQGITIDRNFFRRDPRTGAWNTGLALVDQFLNEVNSSALQRRPSIWSPSVKYARPSPV